MTTKTNQEKIFSRLPAEDKVKFNDLYSKLKNILGDQEKAITRFDYEEKTILVEARDKLEPDWNYKYPFFWGDLVVNANWLDCFLNPTIQIWTTSEYNKINPFNKPINS